MTPADKQLAVALLRWYDRTHGNSFGHDHHCPVRDDAPPDIKRCTCGWAQVQRSELKREREWMRTHDH